MSCRKNPQSVWSNFHRDNNHADYYKFVLRNGDVEPNTFRSRLNNENTEFLENNQKASRYMIQHKLKGMDREPFIFDSKGNIELDEGFRGTIYDRFREDEEDETTRTFIDTLQSYPQLRDSEEVRRFVENIQRQVGFDIPHRQEVIDNLVKEFVITKIRERVGFHRQGVMEEHLNRIGARMETTQELLDRLTQLQVAEETARPLQEAGVAVDGEEVSTAEQEREKMEQEAFGVGGAGVGVPPSEVGTGIQSVPTEGTDAPLFVRTRSGGTYAILVDVLEQLGVGRPTALEQLDVDARDTFVVENPQLRRIMRDLLDPLGIQIPFQTKLTMPLLMTIRRQLATMNMSWYEPPIEVVRELLRLRISIQS
jgi:hypothetical protein